MEFKRALEVDPNLYSARLGLGQVLRKKNDSANAVSALREAIRINPSSSEAYNELGLVLSEQGERSSAAEAFQKALQLDPGNGAAKARLEALTVSAAAKTTPGNSSGQTCWCRSL